MLSIGIRRLAGIGGDLGSLSRLDDTADVSGMGLGDWALAGRFVHHELRRRRF
jgi:hypothetical protein